MFRYYIGAQIFPDVLLSDMAGPDGNPFLLSLKLSVDVLVSNAEHTVHWGISLYYLLTNTWSSWHRFAVPGSFMPMCPGPCHTHCNLGWHLPWYVI